MTKVKRLHTSNYQQLRTIIQMLKNVKAQLYQQIQDNK
jgi:hypothetical protein